MSKKNKGKDTAKTEDKKAPTMLTMGNVALFLGGFLVPLLLQYIFPLDDLLDLELGALGGDLAA